MVLAIDIGNTNIVIGLYRSDELAFSARIATDPLKTDDEYMMTLYNLLTLHRIPLEDLEGGILSSVVPQLKPVFCSAVDKLIGKQLIVIGSGIRTGLNILIKDPSKLGSDLVVGAVAAIAKYPRPIALFDLGTATTVSVIDAAGSYRGGMIIPGLRVSVDALSASAAQLPAINIEPPEKLIGTDTIACIQSGLIHGNAAMVDGIIDRIEAELGTPVTGVLTGGLSGLILPYCRRKLHHDPNLLMDGLKLLYHKNQPDPK